jgi:hypothetical protein
MNLIKDFFELTYIIILAGINATIKVAEYLVVIDSLFIRSVSLMLAVDFRHNAFFRQTLGKVLNPAAFNTRLSDI